MPRKTPKPVKKPSTLRTSGNPKSNIGARAAAANKRNMKKKPKY